MKYRDLDFNSTYVRWKWEGQKYEMREPDIAEYYVPGHLPLGPWERWAVDEFFEPPKPGDPIRFELSWHPEYGYRVSKPDLLENTPPGDRLEVIEASAYDELVKLADKALTLAESSHDRAQYWRACAEQAEAEADELREQASLFQSAASMATHWYREWRDVVLSRKKS